MSWVTIMIFSFTRKIIPSFPVLLLNRCSLMAAVYMLLSFTNKYTEVVTSAVRPFCCCNICYLLYSAFAYLFRN